MPHHTRHYTPPTLHPELVKGFAPAARKYPPGRHVLRINKSGAFAVATLALPGIYARMYAQFLPDFYRELQERSPLLKLSRERRNAFVALGQHLKCMDYRTNPKLFLERVCSCHAYIDAIDSRA